MRLIKNVYLFSFTHDIFQDNLFSVFIINLPLHGYPVMTENQQNSHQTDESSITYTVRNIPASLDRVITDLAMLAGKPKTTFLREYLVSSFRDGIDEFSLKSPLVATLDEDLARELGAGIDERRYQNHFITRWNREFQTLLGIRTEEELRRVLLNNAPYLQARAHQVVEGWATIPRGISLTFALFAELAGRGKTIIDEAWKRIFYSQLPEAKHRYYQYIDAIRALKKLRAVEGDSWAGDAVTVRIYRPEEYAYGAWRVLLILNEGVTAQPWNIPFPVLKSRRFTADPGFDAQISDGPDKWHHAFRFVNGICELHLYSNGCEEEQNPTPLPDVAQALINAVVHELL